MTGNAEGTNQLRVSTSSNGSEPDPSQPWNRQGSHTSAHSSGSAKTPVSPVSPMVQVYHSLREKALVGLGKSSASSASLEFESRPSQVKLREVISSIQEESARYTASKKQKRPWEEAAEDGAPWPAYRVFIGKTLMSQRFEAIMGGIILLNVYLIVYEADHEANCFPEYYHNLEDCPHGAQHVLWLVIANYILLTIYTVEAFLGILTFRAEYFSNRWNCLDFFVVLTGLISELVGGLINAAFLRIFRIARLIRAFRIVLTVRELYMLLSGFGSSLKAMFFGMLLLAGMLVVWSIILVEFVHPTNSLIEYDGCERCPRGYKSVYNSCITLFQQIVAGDSWGTPSVTIIEREPLTLVPLVLVVITVSLGVMNLILAVIVESAAEARERDMEEKTRQKQKVLLEQKIKLLRLCADMDTDNSGSVSLEELYGAWESSFEFRNVMMSLEVRKEELVSVFNLMDQHGEGEVDYKEFVDQLYTLSTCDMRMMLALSRMEINALKNTVDNTIIPKVDRTSKQVEQQWDLISKQSGTIEAINGSVKNLDIKKEVAEQKVDQKSDKATKWNGESVKGEAQDTMTAIKDLREFLQELMSSKAEIMRKAEEQEATLLSHAEVLSTVHAALANPSGYNDKQTTVGKQVKRIREHVQSRLAPALQELERRVDEEVTVLKRSNRLVDGLAVELKIPPARPQKLKRGSIPGYSNPFMNSAESVPAPPETNRPTAFQTGSAAVRRTRSASSHASTGSLERRSADGTLLASSI